jgi:hypothetical protein
MQTSIRKWLLASYAANISRLAGGGSKNPTAAAFLVYTALPSLNDLIASNGTVTLINPPKGDIVWDCFDTTTVEAVCDAFALQTLQANVNKIGAMLAGIPQQKSNAGYYTGQGQTILGMVSNASRPIEQNDPIMRLLEAECTVINNAKNAFEGLRKAGSKDIQNALPPFTAAIVNIVKTFNSNIARLSLDAPEIMRLFAPLIMQGAVESMFGKVGSFSHDATFDIAVLKNPALPATADAPAADATTIRQLITSFS